MRRRGNEHGEIGNEGGWWRAKKEGKVMIVKRGTRKIAKNCDFSQMIKMQPRASYVRLERACALSLNRLIGGLSSTSEDRESQLIGKPP